MLKKIFLSLNNYLLDYIRIFKASGDTDCETYIYTHTQRKHFSENVCAYVLSHVRLCNPPGSSGHGIFQARIAKQVAISCSRASS